MSEAAYGKVTDKSPSRRRKVQGTAGAVRQDCGRRKAGRRRGAAGKAVWENQITPEKAAGHFRTVTEHKLLVMKHCFAIGLYYQGIMHDMSKYSPAEFVPGCRYYQDGKRSPNNGEREDKGYSYAWMHHKGRNRHHFEFWMDYSLKPVKDGPPMQAVQMPRKYVAEMLMDRMAASKIYLKEAYTRHEPLKYYQRGRGHRLMHPQTARELERMLRILDKEGEQALFRFVRQYYLKGYLM